ncbi:MAG TPA: hypothetical protein VFO08_07550 [Methylomirabilota bacterium]|nr:hypothetical protein [Methylomirabilota bacterium]
MLAGRRGGDHRSQVKSGSLNEEMKAAAADGEKPCRAREAESPARISRIPAQSGPSIPSLPWNAGPGPFGDGEAETSLESAPG